MTGPIDDNQEHILDEAVQQYIEAQLKGEEPDLDEFAEKYPEFEHQMKQKIQNLRKIETLFDSIVQADESDFDATANAHDLTGQKVGTFEITDMIGRGGMGVVYLARDTKLDRSVAIKSMPAELQANSTARMRFKREAQLLASLNHPNIAVIHDIIEQDDDSSYLVLEYIPGETLTERLARQPVKLEETLSIGLQIAEALAGAYEQGVIHRDLKPGNTMITPDGRVKVLDFGLAKATETHDKKPQGTITQAGRIVGTPAYMSPEQARGNPTDHRTDIWSFGCVMYEMLTGQLPFDGETATDTVARVLERDPDWQALPQETPENIRVMLRRCLEKKPRQRLQHIGDAVIEIQETLNLPAHVPPQTTILQTDRQPLAWPRLIALMAVGVIMGGTLIGAGVRSLWPSDSIPRAAVKSFSVYPETESLGALGHHSLALSPDGGLLAYIERGNDGRRRICLRSMQTGETTPLSGTDGGTHPFFSPDGRWVAYFDDFQKKIEKVSIKGGEPIALAECVNSAGVTWGTDDYIIFAPMYLGGLWRISASGEALDELTHPDPNLDERGHRWPQILPDGDHVLFTNHRWVESNQIEVYSLKTGKRRVLFKGGSYARYLPTGHIVYGHHDTLYAVACDLAKFQVSGSHVPVVQEVLTTSTNGSAPFTFSQDDGSLAYIPFNVPNKKLEPVWVTEDGAASSLAMTKRNYHSVSVSPDGAYVAFRVPPLEDNVGDLWIYDLVGQTEEQLARDISGSTAVWTPDSNEVIYNTFDPYALFRLKIDGTEERRLIAQFERNTSARSCSPDGKVLLADRDNDHIYGMDWDIWTVPLDEGSTVTAGPVIERFQSQNHGTWSPDGHWIAYSSTETGVVDVYVEPYPGPGKRTKISTGGGHHPVWSRSREVMKLFYLSGKKKMVSATIETEPKPRVTDRKELFDWKYSSCGRCQTYDVAPDGRFLMIRDPEGPPLQRINVVLNWFDELKRLVPTEKD